MRRVSPDHDSGRVTMPGWRKWNSASDGTIEMPVPHDLHAKPCLRATHLEALVAMGTRSVEGPDHHLEVPDGLKPASIYLFEASVTATETAILAAAAAKGVSEIRHAACEPHVVELCVFLQKLGVGITGAGSSTS